MKITRKKYCWIIALILMAGVFYVSPANSTQTEIWTTSTFEEFQRGESQQVSLTETGEITLAPQSQQLLTLQGNDLLIWTMVEDSRGNLYVGTGEQGRIFKIAPAGEVSLFFDSPEIGILSLAVDAKDNVYAGSAPDGVIYKITPEGSQTTFFMTEEHYVWTLVFGPNNILYAGTGETGKIFKILADGAGTVLYDSPQSHIMSLLYDSQGWLYAGTEGKGITYKVDLDGNAFVMYQAKEEEIHSLTSDSQGNLYIAAISNKVYPKGTLPVQKEQQPAPQEKSLKKSTIYRISPQGTVSVLLELPNTLIYAMIADEHDHLLVGTDNKGMLYRVFPNGQYHQMLGVDAENILALLLNSEGTLYLGTSDPGSVYHLSSLLAEEGEYISVVHDAKTTATWGKIFWRGTTQQIKLFTRTGNTETPDDTWSSWSGELQNKDGDTIPNPSARFVQWKTLLTPQEQQNPVLEEVSVAYLPNNLVPEIDQIAIYSAVQQQSEQPVAVRRQSGGNSSPPRPSQAKSRKQKKKPEPPKYIPPGYIAIAWSAEDPNNESLIYTVSLRGEQESTWKVLEEELEEPQYLLDTTTLPDAGYYVKISADDSLDNPPANVLETEKVSERFDVDNTAPQISIALNQQQGQKKVLLTVVAQDEFSRLQRAEYSVDAGDWISIFPDDQVTDSRDEKYSVKLPNLTPGEHILVFKASDTFNNIGVGKIHFSQ